MCEREEPRMFEAVMRTMFKPMLAVCPTVFTTPTTTMAKAMVNCAVSPAQTNTNKWDIFANKAIFQLAGEVGKK